MVQTLFAMNLLASRADPYAGIFSDKSNFQANTDPNDPHKIGDIGPEDTPVYEFSGDLGSMTDEEIQQLVELTEALTAEPNR